MAKALNPLSIAEGKLGNVVYYKIKNAASGLKQGAREYVAQPSNPQTTAQIDQRIKMTTVTNCYRTFKDVIQRAFEGTEYGQKSYQRWASLAMGKANAGPFLPKGNRTPCPVLGVPMSIGSLPQVSVTNLEGIGLQTSLSLTAPQFGSMGDFSTALLDRNTWLQVGDQVTICVIAADNVPDGLLFGGSYSFYLNPNDTSPMRTFVGCTLSMQNNYMCIEDDANIALCAAVIISREGSHLRSTAYWGTSSKFSRVFITDYDEDFWNSYKKSASTRASDWPVDPDAGVPVAAFKGVTASGLSVLLQQLRVEDGYLVATASDPTTGRGYGEVWFKVTDLHSGLYDKWLSGYASATATAPDGIAPDDTIPVVFLTDATPAQIKLFDWLVANGVDERFMYLGGL